MMFTALGGSIGVVAQFLPSRAEQMVSFLASGMSVAGYIAENGYDWLQPMLFAKDINDEAVDQLLQNISLSNPDMIGTFETFDGWVATYGVPQVLAWMKSALESKHLAVEDLSSYAADGYDSLLMEIVASVKNKTVGMVVLPSHQETMKLLADSATRPAAIAALENLIPFGIAGYQVQKKEYGDSKWLEARSLFTQLHLSQYTVLGDPNGVSGMDPHTLEELRVALQTFMLREGIDGGRVEFEDAAILDENIFMQLGNDHTGVSKIVFGGDAADGAVGGAKKDLLFTGAGNDTLNGGEGNDYLDGGSGSDTYLINGEDVVADADMQGKIIFANNNLQAAAFVSDGSDSGVWYGTQKEQGSDASSLIARRSDSDLIVAHINGTDTALIKDFFVRARENGSGGLAALGIELDVVAQGAQTAVRYASGVLNRYNLIYASAPLYTQVRGGDLDDLLMANGSGGVHASLGSGNDRVFGSYLADYIDGGDGNDILNGSQFIPAGSNKPKEEMALDTDIIIGGGGRDLINGMAGNDIIHTGLKNEHTYTAGRNERGDWALGGLGNDSIFGSTEHDLLMGGADSDTVYGGAGDDVILGDGGIRFGNRTLSESGTPPDIDIQYNRLGLGQWQPTVTHIPGTAVAVEHTVLADQIAPQTKGLYSFAKTHPDNDLWTLEINREAEDYTLTTKVPLNENDHRVAVGGSGDFLYGGEGDDLMIGQDGSDYLYGGAGEDILYGDDNREDIANYGNDYLNGGSGNDRLYGGKGNDALIGGSGSDHLFGGEGNDSYRFDSKDLQIAADENVIHDSDGKGSIVIDGSPLEQYGWIAVGGEGSVANRWQAPGVGLQLSRAGNDLELTAETFAAKIVVRNFSQAQFGLNLPAAFIAQEPQTPDTPVVPNEPATPQLSNQAPLVAGSFAAQKLTAGEEWWYALPDNRFIDADGDRLAYNVTLADGSPLPDWLRFDPDSLTLTGTPAAISEMQLNVSVSDGKGGTAVSPLLLNIVAAGRYQRPDSTLSGTDIGEALHGSDHREDLNGYGGNDVIYGYGGNDVINGGAGNDYLEGGDGADTYVFSEEWGQDTVAAVNGEDHMYFKDTVLSQISFSREGADLLMGKTGTSDQIRIINQFGSATAHDALGIVNWEFADGQILKAADVYALTEAANTAAQTNGLLNAMAAFGSNEAVSDSTIVPADNRTTTLLSATAA
ncbi:putative Ig domain-containing protein [Neisseria sp.]|uniref:putative Ig domain-containing protein n=1 Tax=Neisseria sp. TaxID=192066 RepID=UPI0026DCEC5C|nr:putative Ig domain-containing protein [Neisseria sp.]